MSADAVPEELVPLALVRGLDAARGGVQTLLAVGHGERVRAQPLVSGGLVAGVAADRLAAPGRVGRWTRGCPVARALAGRWGPDGSAGPATHAADSARRLWSPVYAQRCPGRESHARGMAPAPDCRRDRRCRRCQQSRLAHAAGGADRTAASAGRQRARTARRVRRRSDRAAAGRARDRGLGIGVGLWHCGGSARRGPPVHDRGAPSPDALGQPEQGSPPQRDPRRAGLHAAHTALPCAAPGVGVLDLRRRDLPTHPRVRAGRARGGSPRVRSAGSLDRRRDDGRCVPGRGGRRGTTPRLDDSSSPEPSGSERWPALRSPITTGCRSPCCW